jgi:hypothetical protein
VLDILLQKWVHHLEVRRFRFFHLVDSSLNSLKSAADYVDLDRIELFDEGQQLDLKLLGFEVFFGLDVRVSQRVARTTHKSDQKLKPLALVNKIERA